MIIPRQLTVLPGDYGPVASSFVVVKSSGNAALTSCVRNASLPFAADLIDAR